MNAGNIPNHRLINASALRGLQGPPRLAVQSDDAQRGPSDGVTLSSADPAVAAQPSKVRKAVANVVSLLAIGGAIACGAAGMVAAPAILVGVSLVSGWMATDKDTPSKFTAWMNKREAEAQARDLSRANDPASGELAPSRPGVAAPVPEIEAFQSRSAYPGELATLTVMDGDRIS